MKKVLALLLALGLLFTMVVGCSSQPDEVESSAPLGDAGISATTTTTAMAGAADDQSGTTQATEEGQTTTVGTGSQDGSSTQKQEGTTANGNNGGQSAGVTTTTTRGGNSSFQASGYVKDLKGRTIRYGYNTYFEAPDATTAVGKKTLAHYADIEKRLNCKIVWNPKKLTHEQTLMGIASGTPEVDIIMSWGVSALYDYCQKKYVTALDTLNVVDFTDEKTYGVNIRYSKLNGHNYAIPVKDAGWNGIPLLFYNKAVLKKAGYTPESLDKLQQSGQWTWDTFLTVLEKVKATGSVDKPLSDGALYFYNTLLAANGADWVTQKADGTFSFTADSPKAVEAMNYYAKLTQLGLVENVEAGDVSGIWYDINRGAASQSAFWMSWYGMTEIASFPKASVWGAMYPPKKDASSKYVSPNTTIQFYSVAAGVNKPAEVLTVMSEMVKVPMSEKELTDSRKALITAAVSDKYTLNNFLTVGSIEVFTNTDFAAAANILTGKDKDGWNYQVAKIASGQMTMAQAIQSYKKVYNNRLKELFG